MKLDAEKLGQMLLMQSILINLPNEESVFSFVCRGLQDIPGVAKVEYCQKPPTEAEEDRVDVPVEIDSDHFGYILLFLEDDDAFSPYSDYISNFIFTVAVILVERKQRRLRDKYQDELEREISVRTEELRVEIEERKAMEEAIRESEERYRLTIQASNDGIFDLHMPDGKVMYSDRWFTMLGYSPDDFSHDYSTWKELLPPEERDETEARIWELITTQKHWQSTFRMRAKDGSFRWILVKGMCIERDDKGTPVRVIGTHTDITARVEAEEKLKVYQEHLENLVEERTRDLQEKNDVLEDTMARYQESQSHLIMLEKMGALRHLVAGIAHEINNPLGAIESSRDVLESSLKRVLSLIPEIASWLKEPNGELFTDLINFEKYKSGYSTELSTKDKRRLREEYIDKLKSVGIEDYTVLARKMVDMYVTDGIEKYIPLLQEKDISYKIDAMINVIDIFSANDNIKSAILRTSKIVNALNNYISKDVDHESGRTIKGNVDIGKSIENVLVLFQGTIRKNIDVDLYVEEGLACVFGAADELNQVWTNIIQNAIQAMEGKGQLAISVQSAEDGIVIKIADSGCGMTEEVKRKVFEPMFTTRSAGEGIGLGMDIVNKIVKKHNGSVEIESEPGLGTTVSVFLPVIRELAAQ